MNDCACNCDVCQLRRGEISPHSFIDQKMETSQRYAEQIREYEKNRRNSDPVFKFKRNIDKLHIAGTYT